ncbi:glycosyl hydrolase family 95 catalytic domain-containing protein [Arthrobacter sp. AZCC_0090]|uniref:glycoside hydrolase family 95 protein n=1 Tax=Arthrobacter sp. AZCC_0090 TaxID=2735881 RepID=UPI00160C7F6F|nr:glycoside hydrolase family 95 protein [Arthrobacter sp. AZCC_0090]MBB6406782.1 alpha-L-fucosidase 2 [Arthrobacter sp. AZCC_0090]
MQENTLRYDRPAAGWLEALPLGNGLTGAMIFGGIARERIQVNDASAWSGSPASEHMAPQIEPESAAELLASAREMVAAGEFGQATQKVQALQHRHSQSYLPFGDVYLNLIRQELTDRISNYSRHLDLAAGVHTTEFEASGSRVQVRSFISHDPDVMVVRVETSLPEGLDLCVSLETRLQILGRNSVEGMRGLRLKMPTDVFVQDGLSQITYDEDDALSLKGALVVKWEHDGIELQGGHTSPDVRLQASGVHAATLYIGTKTTFTKLGENPQGTAEDCIQHLDERLTTAVEQGSAALEKAHLASHGALYQKSQMCIDGSDEAQLQATDARLASANAHTGGPLAADPGLAALMFNYGRYLLMSSSRPGGVPANLQGIWNDQLPAPWNSNYTTNINLQMNYWAAETANLAECAQPLFDFIQAAQITGGRTASRLYGARGWVMHHNSDIWAYSLPVGHGRFRPTWSFWPVGGLWLANHLWDHVRFGATEDFGRKQAWPALRGAARFALDLTVENADGSVGTCPSTSPENAFEHQGRPVDLGVSSTLDLSLVREVFTHLVALARLLRMEDDPVVREAVTALPKLPMPSVGRGGRIREWLADDPEWEPEHRHLSHLYFLYPGDLPSDEVLRTAASASLDARGDESTGWSLVWKLALRARLGQAGKVSDLLRLFFRDMKTDRGGQSAGLYANLFSAHPPFQIDGNLGFVAALSECFIQSHGEEIVLLPALPKELRTGSVKGLRARTGIEVSLTWRDGSLTAAELISDRNQQVIVRLKGRPEPVDLRAGRPRSLSLW